MGYRIQRSWTAQIPQLTGADGVMAASKGHDSTTCRGWIPAVAGMTEVEDLGRGR